MGVTAEARPLVMHVIHHLVIGGMENGLVNLINHLPEQEFRHVVVCVEDFSNFRSRITRTDVDVIALHRSRTGAMALRRSLYRLCVQLRPAILHSRNQSGLDALLPAFLARVPARVHGEHGWDVNNIDGRQWKPALLRRLHAPLVSRYVAVSRDLSRFLVDRVGIGGARVTTICNGVDTERFSPGPVPAGLELPPHFLHEGVIRIGTVGRLQPVKDQGTLAEAVAALLRRRPELRPRVRLVFVGDGPSRNELTQRVRVLGLEDLTCFAGASHEVQGWLRAMDVFVLPSLNEGISNTLLEAMATGVPTLATAVGGNVELVQEGQGGGLFAPGDVAALAAKLALYLDDPALRLRDAALARRRAEELFSLQTMVAGYRGLYRSLAPGPTASWPVSDVMQHPADSGRDSKTRSRPS